jgi:hypothetical protein
MRARQRDQAVQIGLIAGAGGRPQRAPVREPGAERARQHLGCDPGAAGRAIGAIGGAGVADANDVSARPSGASGPVASAARRVAVLPSA